MTTQITNTYWTAGNRVQAGAAGTEDHDVGTITAVDVDSRGHEMVTVGWDSGVVTCVDADDDNCDLRGA